MLRVPSSSCSKGRFGSQKWYKWILCVLLSSQTSKNQLLQKKKIMGVHFCTCQQFPHPHYFIWDFILYTWCLLVTGFWGSFFWESKQAEVPCRRGFEKQILCWSMQLVMFTTCRLKSCLAELWGPWGWGMEQVVSGAVWTVLYTEDILI